MKLKLQDVIMAIIAIALLTVFIVTGVWIVFAILGGVAIGALLLLVAIAGAMEYLGDLHERWEERNDSLERNEMGKTQHSRRTRTE